jgi:hypothetical protein
VLLPPSLNVPVVDGRLAARCGGVVFWTIRLTEDD